MTKKLNKPIKEVGQRGFLLWLKSRQPRVYQSVRANWNQTKQLSGFGAITSDPATTAPASAASPTWANTITQLVTTASQVYLTAEQMKAQRDLMRTQLLRAQQGLAPLDIDPSVYGLQPTARVGFTSDTQKLLIYGGLGVAALWMLGIFKRGRA